MTFPGRRISLGRSSREGRESLLVNAEHNNGHLGGYSSGGSDSFEVSAAMKNRRTSPSTSPVDSRLPPTKNTHDEATLHFVPAFQDAQPSSMPDTSWDAILDEGAAAFPQGPRSDIAGKLSGSRFRRKAQSTIGHPSVTARRESDAASSVSVSRSKGPRIARLASLFSGSGTTSKPTTTSYVYNSKKSTPQNTTDATLPSSPSRSSSSGGYVGWPGTQDKEGRTVAIESSYEESEAGPNDPPARSSPSYDRDFRDERERLEAQEWMQSPAFQDISGVMADPDVSGITLPDPPSPPGEKADDSLYFEPNHENTKMVHMSQLFHSNSGWDVGSSPSRSSFSRNSSAYFDNDVRPTAFPVHEGERRRQAVAGVMRGISSPQPPTEESLALNNSFSPPTRTFNADASRGFRGLIDKAHDVPNLMDAMDSDSMASSGRGSSNVGSNAGNGPPGAYHGTRRQSELMPRVKEEDYMTRDTDSDVFDEISKYSIGDSELFEGISDSHSKQSTYEFRDSDAFDGVSKSVVEESKASLKELRSTTSSVERRHQKDNKQTCTCTSDSNIKLVLLGGGLTTIQTTNEDFSKRISASDYDECLTNSDIDEYGHPKLPSFEEMLAAGRSPADNASVVDVPSSVDQSFTSPDTTSQSFNSFGANRSQNNGGGMIGQSVDAIETEKQPHNRRITNSSDHGYKDDESAFFSDFYSADDAGFEGDLSEYYVQPSMVKQLVRRYRKLCRVAMTNCQDYDELDRVEDEKKVFALFEMRSRIMEKDIERGLERRGGTTVVDDIVMTPSNRRAMRIRDAVIVSKAWRDGASPIDVINTANLTQRDQRSYFIRRPVRSMKRQSGRNSTPRYRWEEVAWIDDTDFMQYGCPSLGARHLRGSEMFTIGDCQSILLKLTNEACIELREELNDATARQIEAEELMREEGDYGDGMMTESEMIYLSAMEEVKTISRKLVVAEKAFALVRDRIRHLVQKYEQLLTRLEDEEMTTSSVVTADSSCYSDEYDSRVSTDYDEELTWQRRQQRAEVSAELAAREALLAKQSEAREVQEQKHKELKELQNKLAELQSEPSTATTDRQRSAILARAIASRHQPSKEKPVVQNDSSSNRSNVEGVKQRFRDRMAARLRQNQKDAVQGQAHVGSASNRYFMQEQTPKPASTKGSNVQKQKLIRLAGEEMFSHLDFYQRSLDAVQSNREGVL